MASCTGATMALASLLRNEFKMFKLSKLRCLHLRLFVQRLPALPQGALPCCQNHRISSISASSFHISAREHPPKQRAHPPKTSMSARFKLAPLERTPKQCISSISARLFHLKAPPQPPKPAQSLFHISASVASALARLTLVHPRTPPPKQRISSISACPKASSAHQQRQLVSHQHLQETPQTSASAASPPDRFTLAPPRYQSICIAARGPKRTPKTAHQQHQCLRVSPPGPPQAPETSASAASEPARFTSRPATSRRKQRISSISVCPFHLRARQTSASATSEPAGFISRRAKRLQTSAAEASASAASVSARFTSRPAPSCRNQCLPVSPSGPPNQRISNIRACPFYLQVRPKPPKPAHQQQSEPARFASRPAKQAHQQHQSLPVLLPGPPQAPETGASAASEPARFTSRPTKPAHQQHQNLPVSPQARPKPPKPAHEQHQNLPVSPPGPPNQRISNIRACPFHLQARQTSASAASEPAHFTCRPAPSPRNQRISNIRACPFHLQARQTSTSVASEPARFTSRPAKPAYQHYPQARPKPAKPAHQQHQSLPVSPPGTPNQRISSIRACPFHLQAPETSASATSEPARFTSRPAPSPRNQRISSISVCPFHLQARQTSVSALPPGPPRARQTSASAASEPALFTSRHAKPAHQQHQSLPVSPPGP